MTTRQELVEPLRAAGPRPAAVGDSCLQLLLDDPMTSFDSAAVEAVMGVAARTRLTGSLAARWRAAKDAVLALCAGAAADRDVDTLRTDLQGWLVAREQQVVPHIRARPGEAGIDVMLRADVLCLEPRWCGVLATV